MIMPYLYYLDTGNCIPLMFSARNSSFLVSQVRRDSIIDSCSTEDYSVSIYMTVTFTDSHFLSTENTNVIYGEHNVLLKQVFTDTISHVHWLLYLFFGSFI